MWARIDDTVGKTEFEGNIQDFGVVILLIAIVSVCMITSKGRSLLRKVYGNSTVIVASGIIPAGVLMAILTDNSSRCYFWCDLMVVIYLMTMVYYGGVLRNKPKTRRFVTTLLATVCIIQSLLCIKLQWAIRKENDKLMEMIAGTETGILFYDKKFPPHMPWYCMRMPVNNFWDEEWQYIVIYTYLSKEYCSIVPEKLKNIRVEELQPIRTSPTFYLINDDLVSENFIKSEWSEYNLGITHLKKPEYRKIPVEVEGKIKKGEEKLVYPFITAPYRHADNAERPDTLLFYKP